MRKKEMARRIEELKDAVWDMKYPMGVIKNIFYYDDFRGLLMRKAYKYKNSEPPIVFSTDTTAEYYEKIEIKKVENNLVYILQYSQNENLRGLFYCVINTETKEVTEVNEKWQKIVQY